MSERKEISDIPLLIFDGGFGTTMQDKEVPDTAWDHYEGCNEYLNLSAPDLVSAVHREFLEAGAQVVETNTFGASRIVLAEYALEERVREINRAAVANARSAMRGVDGPRFVAGSIGPTTKLPSLGHIPVDDLRAAVLEQATVLLEAGVDMLLLETCQDLLQLKTALIAVFESIERTNAPTPVMVSVTMERTGTMLVGTDIGAVVATLEPFPILSLGLNCATGPADMESHIRYLSQQWPGRISCMPNQGMPEMLHGRTHYPMTPDEFTTHMRRFVERYGVSVVGGCCGTSPAHIRALARTMQGVVPAQREVER